MGKTQRVKGRAWEQQVARDLRAITGDARRGLQFQDGHDAPDVLCPVLHPECKVGARPNLLAALEQAEATRPPGKYAVAICKRDREEPTITLRWDDFLDLFGAWWKERNR